MKVHAGYSKSQKKISKQVNLLADVGELLY